jgi:hypothetical protein
VPADGTTTVQMNEPSREEGQMSEKRGPRFIWWGWKNWWKRPVWFSRGILGAPHVRELGIGPISYVWSADDGLFAWRRR